jgi:hypothetical protein
MGTGNSAAEGVQNYPNPGEHMLLPLFLMLDEWLL